MIIAFIFTKPPKNAQFDDSNQNFDQNVKGIYQNVDWITVSLYETWKNYVWQFVKKTKFQLKLTNMSVIKF